MTTQPIKSLEILEEFKKYYKITIPNPRNYTLICMGINTALRVSDMLVLIWGDVYDFKRERFKKHIIIVEKKTKKENIIAINQNLTLALSEYMQTLKEVDKQDYIFAGRYGKIKPLSRSQAFRVVKNAALTIIPEENISCHSLRKTFGYHAWQAGVPPILIMSVYNHSSYNITKRYIGVDQDDKDKLFLKINL